MTMGFTTSRLRAAAWASLLCMGLLSGQMIAAPAAQAQATAGTALAGGRHTLNLRDADINAFIDDVSALTGYTFIVHPMVKGRVTVVSQAPLTTEEVFDVFLSTLRVQGYTAIPTSGGAYRIVPDQTAAEDASFGDDATRDDTFVTEVVRMRYVDAREAAAVVKPLVNGRGQVSANERGNVVVIVDYASNIARIRQVLTEMDQDNSMIRTVPLQNMPAAEMARVLNGLRDGGGSENLGGSFTAVAVERGNAVVIRGDQAAVERVARVIAELDATSAPTENLKVIYLRHANAAELVPILDGLSATLAETSTDGVARPPKITAHEPTNALIVSASPSVLASIERVVADLDIRRAQVQIEAIIVEMSDQTAKDLGLQFLLSGSGDNSTPFAATNFSRSAPNLLAITGALSIDADNEEDSELRQDLQQAAVASLLGTGGLAFGVGGQSDDGTLFGVILNALSEDTGSNILSQPQVLTLDNEEAKFLVGQEIPITTGEVLGSDNSNPFRTIERKEIGVRLNVKPQITDGGTIRLVIAQEVSSLAGAVGPNFPELITNTRSIDTTVLADDGEIIVLGGLIENRETTRNSRVPVLGDLPGVGRAFRSEGRSMQRTNLVVFIRPTIVRNAADMESIAQAKYDFLRSEHSSQDAQTRARLDAILNAVQGAG